MSSDDIRTQEDVHKVGSRALREGAERIKHSRVLVETEPKIYIVTSGEYSDYGIDAVFLSKALAEEYAALRNHGATRYARCEVETWDATTEQALRLALEQKRQGLRRYIAYLYESGRSDVFVDTEDLCGKIEEPPTFEDGWRGKGFQMRVWARDEKHAIKIASDRRARMLAET